MNIKEFYDKLPRDLQKKLSLHDLKRITDAACDVMKVDRPTPPTAAEFREAMLSKVINHELEKTYEKRNARPPSVGSPHYMFYTALVSGRKVRRKDVLNGVEEVLTLDHPGIQGQAANITFYGCNDLSVES